MTFKILYAFGESGDLNSVPDTSTGTELSFQQGWSQAYELAQDQTGYRELDRAQHNFLWNVVTGNIKQWQDQAYPQWYGDFDYPIGAKARHNDVNYNKQTNNDGSASEPGLSSDWVVINELQSQNDIVGGSIFKGSNGETVENGDFVKLGTTHLRILVGGRPKIVAMSPVHSGLVTDLTETSATIGGNQVNFLWNDFYSELNRNNLSQDTIDKLSEILRRNYKYKIKYPSNLESNHLLPISIYWKGSSYFTDFDPRSLKPTRQQTRYVDPILGSDANNGGAGDPYKSISRAMTTAQALDIEVILKSGQYYYKDGLQGTQTNNKGVSIVCPDGVATLTNEAYPRIWREDPANKGVWIADTVIFGEDLFAEKSNIRFIDNNGRVSDTVRGYQLQEDSVANIDAGAIGWVVGSVSMRVRLPYDRDPNTNLVIVYAQSNLVLQCNDLTDQTIYVENVDTLYGSPNSARFDTSSEDSKCILVNCNFNNGRLDDSVEINGTGLTVAYRCSANGAYKDGFNYQTNVAISGSGKHDILEIECTSRRNGIETTGSNNGSTIHGTCNIIRLNCDHSYNQNRNVHDVGLSRSFNVGVRAEGSETYMEGFQSGIDGGSGEASQMWLVGCKSDFTSVSENSTLYKSDDTVEGLLENNGTLLDYNP